jgi:hypothetical protein
MPKLFLTALLAAGAAAALQAQPPSPVQASPDSPGQRKALQRLSACLARARPNWARNTLSHPYLSDAQAMDAAQALRGRDNCMPGDDTEFTFRTSGMVGSLAEHFLKDEMDRADSARLASRLASLAPLNVSEDFALCVAARDPAAARELALSEPGSDAEARAAGRLGAFVEPCTRPGEDLTVDLQSLRALVATALYRGVTAVLASR